MIKVKNIDFSNLKSLKQILRLNFFIFKLNYYFSNYKDKYLLKFQSYFNLIQNVIYIFSKIIISNNTIVTPSTHDIWHNNNYVSTFRLVDMVIIRFYEVSRSQIYSYMIITNMRNLACSQHYIPGYLYSNIGNYLKRLLDAHICLFHAYLSTHSVALMLMQFVLIIVFNTDEGLALVIESTGLRYL